MPELRLRAVALALLAVFAIGDAARASDAEADVQRKFAVAEIPLDKIAAPHREQVNDLLQNAPLYVRGPTEAFPCRPGVYRWALDHPDWIIAGWNALAATPLSIEPQPDGSFVGKDNQGGALRWRCVLCEPGRRIWLAEGTGRMAPFLPEMKLKAVLCLKHQEVVGQDGRVGVRHRAEAFAQYDAKSAAWFSKLVGITPESAGKKMLEQIEIFFSGMAYYVTEHPEWAEKTLEAKAAGPDEKKKLQALKQELTAASRPKAFPSWPAPAAAVVPASGLVPFSGSRD